MNEEVRLTSERMPSIDLGDGVSQASGDAVLGDAVLGDVVAADAMVGRGSRRAGASTIRDGAIAFLVGLAGLWLSFWLADNARTILGAGPLIGGGMMGYGGVELLVGDRLKALKWIVGIVAGLVGLVATLLILESTLGVTFA